MQERDTPKSGESPPDRSAFDVFDDETENSYEEPAPHGHVPVSTSYAPSTGKRLRVFAVAFALILAVAFYLVHQIRSRDEFALDTETAVRAEQAPPVEVITVGLAPPSQTLTLPGEVRGWYASTIYARVNGYVASWAVDIGDRVKKDQMLAMLDTPELDSQLEAAQHELAVAQAEVKVREADAAFARTTFERWQGSPKGVVSEQEREDKKAQYAVAVARLNAAKARANQNQANVDRLAFMAGFKAITAPYDGVITERRIDIGDLVTSGNTLLYGMAQSQEVRMFVNVPQVASGDIGVVGTEARITASEYPQRIFKGKVTRTSESIDPRARTLRVEVDLKNEDLALLPGMYVQAEFRLKPTNFVQVPASALLFRAAGPQVALIRSNETVKFQDVTIARDNGNFVEISSGLSAGDRVALNISSQIADGDRVTVREEAKTAQAR